MDRQLTIWLVIVAVGAVTFSTRVSFIAIFARRAMPPLLAEALKHVPVAMLTAIVVPAVAFISPGVLQLGPDNAKLVAALAAGAVALWRKSVVLTIGAGMIALWSLLYLVG